MSDQVITKPTPEQVTAEIAKLREMKPHIPERSVFNDNNHEAIDADIEVLEKNLREGDIMYRNEMLENDDGEYLSDHAMDSALGALRWLEGDEEMSPSTNWEGLAAV